MPTFPVSVHAEKDTLRYTVDAVDMETCIHLALRDFKPREQGALQRIEVHPPRDPKELQDYLVDEGLALGLAWVPGQQDPYPYEPFAVEVEPSAPPGKDSARVRDGAPEPLRAPERDGPDFDR
jgi:hypothetical protein